MSDESRSGSCPPRAPTGAIVLLVVLLAMPTGASAEDGDSPTLDVPRLGPTEPAPSSFRLAAGPSAALRRMRFLGGGDAIRHRPGIYVGGQLDLAATLHRFESLDASLRLHVDASYGITNSSAPPAPEGRTLVTELMTGDIWVGWLRRLGSRVFLGIGPGFHATSVLLEPNHVYTGHRYLAAQVAARILWLAVPETVTVGAEVAGYPVFAADNSRGAHGEGQSFGARATAEFTWRIAPDADSPALRALRLALRYRYQRFRTQFPRATLGRRGADSVDEQHVATLQIEYALPTGD